MDRQPKQEPELRKPSLSAPVIAIAGLLALAIANGIGRFAFTPILPMMVEDTDLSIAQGGLLASANYMGYLVGALWATVHRARPIFAIRLGFVVTAAGTMAMGAVEGLVAWAGLRLAVGVASAWLVIHGTAWCLERLAPFQRPLLNGLVFAGVGVGIILAGLVCLAVMRLGGSSDLVWVLLGLIAFLVNLGLWSVLGVDRLPRKRLASSGQRYRWTFDSLRLVFCYGAFGLGYIIPGTFVPVMAKNAIQDPAVFGWAWPVFGLAAAVSTLLVIPWLQVAGPRGLWRGAAALMAAGVLAPVLIGGMAGVVVAAFLVGGTFMVITMAGMQEARAVAAEHAAVLIAGMTSAFAAGQIVGPLLISFLIERETGSIHVALWIAFAALASSTFLLSKRRNSATQVQKGAAKAPPTKASLR
jgi:MFS family permease